MATPEEEILASAAQHQEARAALSSATASAALTAWGAVDMAAIVTSWWTGGIGRRIYSLLSASQEAAAYEANEYVAEILALEDVRIRRTSVNPPAFAGVASDGRSLEDLLAGAPILALQEIRQGGSPAVAAKKGADFVKMVVRTQVADAGRTADQVAIATAEPEQPRQRLKIGWVRMLDPPSCSRCVVLAGKFFRWNEGFLRHPMCGCTHIPVAESIGTDFTVDPKAYFESLSTEQQDASFGKATAQAIRDGADVYQVVNATSRGGVFSAGGRKYTSEGATRRGVFGSSSYVRARPGVLRPTPEQIYKDAKGDADEARRLLRQFRYILR